MIIRKSILSYLPLHFLGILVTRAEESSQRVKRLMIENHTHFKCNAVTSAKAQRNVTLVVNLSLSDQALVL